MKTKRKYYYFVEVVFILFLSFGITSCETDDPISTSEIIEKPDPSGGKDDPSGGKDDPNVRSDNEQTVFMYLPWSDNLTSNFYQNIKDMKAIIAQNILKNERVIVYMCTTATKASMYELVYENGAAIEKPLKEYDYSEDANKAKATYTQAEGITSILNDMKDFSPAKRYAMIIGCHGLGWIPTNETQSRSGLRNMRHWEYENMPMTRFFGGTSPKYQTDITTLAQSISDAALKMEYILFDDCYMSTVEVAYDLKEVTKHLIASTSEIMAYGMPYDKIGQYLIGNIDYKSICDGFYDFYSTYSIMPCGTIGVTDCTEIEKLATIMKEINQQYTFDTNLNYSVQRLDGYSPVIFFDCADYVSKLCPDPALLDQFTEQLNRTVPFKRNTDYVYSMSSGRIKINTFSGITISDPSTNPNASSKEETAWYAATH